MIWRHVGVVRTEFGVQMARDSRSPQNGVGRNLAAADVAGRHGQLIWPITTPASHRAPGGSRLWSPITGGGLPPQRPRHAAFGRCCPQRDKPGGSRALIVPPVTSAFAVELGSGAPDDVGVPRPHGRRPSGAGRCHDRGTSVPPDGSPIEASWAGSRTGTGTSPRRHPSPGRRSAMSRRTCERAPALPPSSFPSDSGAGRRGTPTPW